MAKTILGVDIGYDSLKLALVNGKTVRRTAIVPMPKNLIREGRVVSTETMGELIRRTMREHGIRCNQAAIVLQNETVFIRNVTMPVMTVDQLNYNLPFEFRDYITDELKDYLFDYEVVSVSEEKEDSAEEEGEENGDRTVGIHAIILALTILVIGQQVGVRQVHIHGIGLCDSLVEAVHAQFQNACDHMPVPPEHVHANTLVAQIENAVFLQILCILGVLGVSGVFRLFGFLGLSVSLQFRGFFIRAGPDERLESTYPGCRLHKLEPGPVQRLL